MSKIKIGFIGGGFVAQQCHLPTFSDHPSFEIVALADPYADLRQKLARKYSIPTTYSNHKDLLSSPDIDAVIITLPRRLTFNVVKQALLAGKHVFTEKPICLNSTNGHELIDLAKQNSLKVQVGYMKVHDSASLQFKNILHN